MKIREACQILTNRLRDECGLERTPKQVFAFLQVRIVQLYGPLTVDDFAFVMFRSLILILEVADSFEAFSQDIAEGVCVGPLEGLF